MRLKEIREENSLKQIEVANILNVSIWYVGSRTRHNSYS